MVNTIKMYCFSPSLEEFYFQGIFKLYQCDKNSPKMVTLTLLLRGNNSKYGHTEVKVGDQLTNNYVFLAVVVVQLAEWLFPRFEFKKWAIHRHCFLCFQKFKLILINTKFLPLSLPLLFSVSFVAQKCCFLLARPSQAVFLLCTLHSINRAGR